MGKFEYITGDDGRYYFNLLASNGQVIFKSEAYISSAARNNGISSVQLNVADESRFERKISADGKYYFILKAANGQVIGISQMYGSEAGRDNGIEAVKNNAMDAALAV
ncbi:MAG: YegP family protein [Ferruginibacter sp.]